MNGYFPSPCPCNSCEAENELTSDRDIRAFIIKNERAGDEVHIYNDGKRIIGMSREQAISLREDLDFMLSL
jgi:hypothetical protein